MVLYALAQSPDGETGARAVLRSEDRARTWEVRSWFTRTHRLEALAVDPSNSDVVTAGGAGAYQTRDGGATWASLWPTMTVRALAVKPDDPRVLFAITAEGVARSDDGGMTWATICRAGQFDGPAEFVGLSVTGFEPSNTFVLARPTRPDVSWPSTGPCAPPGPAPIAPEEGWLQTSEGLPVFVEETNG
jgi:hypothetical protein